MKFSIQKQIRFHHCDPAGIVFYPQYFFLLHEVQEDFLAHLGHPQHELVGGGLGLPIIDLKTEFIGMCRYGDALNISLQLSRLGQASIGMHYEIHSYLSPFDKGLTLKLRANTVVVCCKLPQGKAVAIPPDLREALRPYLQTHEEAACS